MKRPSVFMLIMVIFIIFLQFGILSADDSSPGTLKWKFQIYGTYNESSPAIGSDGTIYVGGSGYYLYAINLDGTLKWKFDVSSYHSSPAIGSNGTIYVKNDDYLYAINSDGSYKWKFDTYYYISSSPAIGSDGTIYVGTYGSYNYLYAINHDGTLKWKFKTGDDIKSSPAIGSDGTIYVGSEDHFLYAINPDGTLKWKFETGRKIDSSPAIDSDGTIYVGSEDSYLYAVNSDGTLKWKFEAGGYIDSSPAIGADGTIYVGCNDSYLYAINSDGSFKWKFKTGDDIKSSPAIGSDGTIYVGSNDHFLYAVNPDGSYKWAFETGDVIKSPPAIGSDGTIYVVSEDNYLYAINSSSEGLANSPWPKFHHDAQNNGNILYSSIDTCDSKHLYLCTTENVCDYVGGYWYHNICNKNPEKIDGKCGSSAEEEYENKPTSNLCSQGDASEITEENGNWIWTCYGKNGGDNASCSAIHPTCDINHLELCLTESDCNDAGGYWYNNNSCNSTPETFTLTVKSSGISSVTISSSSSIYSGTTDYTKSGISKGTSITLTAPSREGNYNFSYWSGCSSSSGTTCYIDSLNDNTTVTANYQYQLPTYSLTVKSSGISSVSISSYPSNCSGTTDYTKSEISKGTDITLYAPSNKDDYKFDYWSGCSYSSGTTCYINSISSDRTVTVNYKYEPPTYSLTVKSSGISSVSISSYPSSYSGTTDYTKSEISKGTNIILYAPSGSGSYKFTSWSDCSYSSGTTCYIDAIDSDKTVTANYQYHENHKPVANAGDDMKVKVGKQANLDGSASSDEDGDNLTYSWSIVSKPEDSYADLYDKSSETATITPDVAGTYIIQLEVSDGKKTDTDSVVVTAESAMALTISPSTATLIPNGTQQFSVTGGTGKISWNAEAGTIDSLGFYTAPNTTGTYLITATDETGKTVNATVTVIEKNGIAITPAKTWIDRNDEYTFKVVGGVAPYKWYASSGKIESDDETAKYTAPNVSDTVIITVKDNLNQKSTATVYVDLPMQASVKQIYISPGGTKKISVAGGIPPFNWSAQKGDLNEITTLEEGVNVYTAPNITGEDNITVRDQKGSTITIPVYINRNLKVTPTINYMKKNKKTTFKVSGGIVPYTATVIGNGEISPITCEDEPCEFIYISGNVANEKIIIEFEDSASNKVEAQAWVETKLLANQETIYVDKGETVSFKVYGGTGGYIATATSGYVYINSYTGEGTYTAPNIAGDYSITIYDSSGNSVKIEIKMISSCNSDNLELCDNVDDCLNAGGTYINNSCVAHISECSSSNLSACRDMQSCINAGGEWRQNGFIVMCIYKTNAQPSKSLEPREYKFGTVQPNPSDNIVTVAASKSVYIQPSLKVDSSDIGKPATLVMYIYIPAIHYGFMLPTKNVTLSSEQRFTNLPKSLDFSDASGMIFDVYYGYRVSGCEFSPCPIISSSIVKYNTYEVVVK